MTEPTTQWNCTCRRPAIPGKRYCEVCKLKRANAALRNQIGQARKCPCGNDITERGAHRCQTCKDTTILEGLRAEHTELLALKEEQRHARRKELIKETNRRARIQSGIPNLSSKRSK